MSFKKQMSFMWQAIRLGNQINKEHSCLLLGVVLVFWLLLVVVGLLALDVESVVARAAEAEAGAEIGILAMFLKILLFAGIEILLFAGMFAGMMLLVVRRIRGEAPAFRTLFAGFARCGRLAGISALFMLLLAPLWIGLVLIGLIGLIWLISVVAAVFDVFGDWNAGFDVFGGWTGVFVMLAVAGCAWFFHVQWLFASLLCIDPRRQYGVKKSCLTSWRITAPMFWLLLGLFVVNVAPVWLLFLPFAVNVETEPLLFEIILLFSFLYWLFIIFIIFITFIGLPRTFAILAAAYELITDSANIDGTEEAITAPPDTP